MRKTLVASILIFTVLLMMTGVVHGHDSHDPSKWMKKKIRQEADAAFYGIPSVNPVQINAEVVQEEMEVMRSRFWGIPVQTVP